MPRFIIHSASEYSSAVFRDILAETPWIVYDTKHAQDLRAFRSKEAVEIVCRAYEEAAKLEEGDDRK